MNQEKKFYLIDGRREFYGTETSLGIYIGHNSHYKGSHGLKEIEVYTGEEIKEKFNQDPEEAKKHVINVDEYVRMAGDGTIPDNYISRSAVARAHEIKREIQNLVREREKFN